jgi:ubiquinone/menaquinone biosynthesis C-methylase UbiE
MAKVYDRNYGYTGLFTKHKIRKKAQNLINLLEKYKFDRAQNILEVGCGTGAYTLEVAKKLKQAQITAIDVSPEVIKIAKHKTKGLGNVKYKVMSIYDTGIKDHSVDVVFGFYVLHHLALSQAIKEIERILKPGGLLFFYEPNILNPVVYLIKSNKYLKRMAQDSEDEWAINPLTVKNYFPKFEAINLLTSEFIVPVGFIPYKWILKIDELTKYFRYIPIVSYLGGSVQIFARKRK